MPALRIMTWNVHLLTKAMAAIEQISDTAEADAQAVVAKILALETDDPPDVIAFNEVWTDALGVLDQLAEDVVAGLGYNAAKKTLLAGLSPIYPNVVELLGSVSPITGKIGDSGLMIFSRLPFIQRPNGTNFEFRSYSSSAGDDAYSDKGVGLVQIARPESPTTIVFTHMQSSYDDANDEHKDIRASQLKQITDLLREVLGDPLGDRGSWRNVIVLGDMNIRGDRRSRSNEWKDIFLQIFPKVGVFGTGQLAGPMSLVDGWDTYMHVPGFKSPNQPSTMDPGYTNLNLTAAPDDPTSLYRSRLDLQCYPREPELLLHGRLLAPQHMLIRLREPSDHWSLEAVAQHWTPFCTPADAINFLKPDLASQDRIKKSESGMKDVWRVELRVEKEGSYQWLYFEKGGTFSFKLSNFSPDLEMRAYASEDLTHPLRRDDTLDLAQLPLHYQEALHRLGAPLHGLAETFALPPMSFLRFRSNRATVGENWIGTGFVWFFKHKGDSRETAILLKQDEMKNPELEKEPMTQTGDTCWFKANLPRILSPMYTSTFTLFNNNAEPNHTAKWTVHPPVGPPTIRSGDDRELVMQHASAGSETVFLTLDRADVQQVNFLALWQTGISALSLIDTLCLYCEDETGWDVWGSDEITLKLYLDGETAAFYETTWSADTGETLLLADAVKNAITPRLMAAGLPLTEIPFTTGIRIEVMEEDIGTSTANAFFTPPSGPEKKPVRIVMNVQTGQYAMHGTVSSWRSRN